MDDVIRRLLRITLKAVLYFSAHTQKVEIQHRILDAEAGSEATTNLEVYRRNTKNQKLKHFCTSEVEVLANT